MLAPTPWTLYVLVAVAGPSRRSYTVWPPTVTSTARRLPNASAGSAAKNASSFSARSTSTWWPPTATVAGVVATGAGVAWAAQPVRETAAITPTIMGTRMGTSLPPTHGRTTRSGEFGSACHHDWSTRPAQGLRLLGRTGQQPQIRRRAVRT